MKTEKEPLVFIVEDNEAYAEMIRYYVESNGYETRVFHTGGDCLSNMSQKPDILILDFMLGKMNGLEVLKLVKELDQNVKVIFLSAQDDIQVGIDSLKQGAYDYVMKDDFAFGNVIVGLNRICKARAAESRTKTYAVRLKRSFWGVLLGLLSVVLFNYIT